MSSDFDLWNSNNINVVEYYFFDNVNNSDFKIENIMIADEKYQEVFTEINIIADQLSSKELFRHYQKTFMWEMKQQIMTEQKLTLESTKFEEVIDLYDNRFWWLFMQISIWK